MRNPSDQCHSSYVSGPPNALRFCCRGVRRSRAAQQQNIARAAAPRKRPGQQQARVRWRPDACSHHGALGGRVVVRADRGSATSALGAWRVTCERSLAKGWVGWRRPDAGRRSAHADAGARRHPVAGHSDPAGSHPLRSGTERHGDPLGSPPWPRHDDADGASQTMPVGWGSTAKSPPNLGSGNEGRTDASGGTGGGHLTPCASAAGACGGPRRLSKHTRRRAAALRPPAAASAG